MSISVRQLAGAVVVSFCVGAFIAPVLTQTQGGATAQTPSAAKPPTYMVVEFMRSPRARKTPGSNWSGRTGSRRMHCV
jgi:uncharacterized membrane protein YoaK (UPF0700 family)